MGSVAYSQLESDNRFYPNEKGENLEQVVSNISENGGGFVRQNFIEAQADVTIPNDSMVTLVDEQELWWKNLSGTWKFVRALDPLPEGKIEEGEEKAVSGKNVFDYLNPMVVNSDNETIDYTLVRGQVNATTGATSTSVNWLSTSPITVGSEQTYTIEGYGNGNSSVLTEYRVACMNGTTLIGFIGGGFGLNRLVFTTLPGTNNIKINVEGATNAGLDPANSPFYDTFRLLLGEVVDPYLNAEFLKGDIETPQIENMENTILNITESRQDLLSFTLGSGAIRATTGGVVTVSGYVRTSTTVGANMIEYSGNKMFYTGEISNSTYCGVAYFNESFAFLGSQFSAVQSYVDAEMSIPTGTKYIATSSFNGNPIVKQQITGAKSLANLYHVDSISGVVDGDGSKAKPFKTISSAISKALGRTYSKILVKGGVYRESIDLSKVSYENIEIIAYDKEVVQILGSNQITGWTKTAGQTNVYEAAFTGTIISGSRMGRLIIEHGRNSQQILSSEVESLQRGLTHRLPFSVLKEQVSVANVDVNAGSFFTDGTKIYIHTNDSNNPLSNGFSYEYVVRGGVISPTYSPTIKSNLILKNIQFLYNTGLDFRGFNKIERYMCTSIFSTGAGGFRDNTAYVYAYKDEAAYCDGDGINGHMTAIPGYTTLNQREGVQNGIYIEPWCHDNFDDGLSFHERADITIIGGLFEYNGDGGVRQSNDALFRIYDAKSRKNGWDSESSGATKGSGFDMVNIPSTNRQNGSMSLRGCTSENNKIGFGIITGDGRLNIIDSTSRNNEVSEFRAESGKIIAENCKVTNADPAKIKVTTGTGVIEVLTDQNLV